MTIDYVTWKIILLCGVNELRPLQKILIEFKLELIKITVETLVNKRNNGYSYNSFEQPGPEWSEALKFS